MEIMGLMKLLKQLAKQFKKYRFGTAIKNILYHFITRERQKSFGPKNSDKTIYIIRSIDDKSPFYIGPVHNLLANYFYVLSHIQYAKTKGWVPVVDELNYPVYNSMEEPINGTKNAWEYFWQQPGGISLEEAYQSKNVVLSKQSWFWQWDMGYDAALYEDRTVVQQYHQLAQCVPLNQSTQEYVRRARANVFPAHEKVLGVNVRIGGYSVKSCYHGKGHPIQPEIGTLISMVADKMQKQNIDRIFLASDAEFAVDQFREAFQEKLLLYPRLRTEVGKEFCPDSQKQVYSKENQYQTALDYLTEMELLGACDALIGSITSGFRYAVVQNGTRYSGLTVLDLGRFPDEKTKGSSR